MLLLEVSKMDEGDFGKYCLSHLLPEALSTCCAQKAREWKLFPKMNAALRDKKKKKKKSKAGNGKNNGNNEVRRNKSLLRVVHSY